jgi:transcriptional regulator with XRE-family HTH domain
MSLYERVLARPGGGRALAVSRLKRTVLASLHEAFRRSGTASQSDLARRLHVRRSAVNQVLNGDGNLRVSTLAEYLYEMGYELTLNLVKAGEPRAAALAGRTAATTTQQVTVTVGVQVAMYVQSPTGPAPEIRPVDGLPQHAAIEAPRTGAIFVRALGSAGNDVPVGLPLPSGWMQVNQPRSAP